MAITCAQAGNDNVRPNTSLAIPLSHLESPPLQGLAKCIEFHLANLRNCAAQPSCECSMWMQKEVIWGDKDCMKPMV